MQKRSSLSWHENQFVIPCSESRLMFYIPYHPNIQKQDQTAAGIKKFQNHRREDSCFNRTKIFNAFGNWHHIEITSSRIKKHTQAYHVCSVCMLWHTPPFHTVHNHSKWLVWRPRTKIVHKISFHTGEIFMMKIFFFFFFFSFLFHSHFVWWIDMEHIHNNTNEHILHVHKNAK